MKPQQDHRTKGTLVLLQESSLRWIQFSSSLYATLSKNNCILWFWNVWKLPPIHITSDPNSSQNRGEAEQSFRFSAKYLSLWWLMNCLSLFCFTKIGEISDSIQIGTASVLPRIRAFNLAFPPQQPVFFRQLNLAKVQTSGELHFLGPVRFSFHWSIQYPTACMSRGTSSLAPIHKELKSNVLSTTCVTWDLYRVCRRHGKSQYYFQPTLMMPLSTGICNMVFNDLSLSKKTLPVKRKIHL